MPVETLARVRLISRAMSVFASSNSLWSSRLRARGFTSEGLRVWSEDGRPAYELFGRIYRREACEVELLRRSGPGPGRWWAEAALDLLNPYDVPTWLLFSAAVDDSDYSEVCAEEGDGTPAFEPKQRGPSYLQPIADRSSSSSVLAMSAGAAAVSSPRAAADSSMCAHSQSGELFLHHP